MATQQLFLVCDNSTASNFKAWAKPVSDWLRTCGWTNSSDTGQLNGAGAGNWAGVSTVPGSGAFYYEIFQPGDALTTFYLKLEYGNGGSANSPTMRVSIGTGTNGAGTLTGYVTQLVVVAPQSYTAPSTTTTYECDFSGTSSRMCVMMWRNAPNSAPQSFVIQRSLNSSGSETGTYVTVWTAGYSGSGLAVSGYQQSLHFVYGPAPYFANNYQRSNASGWPTRIAGQNGGSSAFNNSTGIDFLQPYIGLWDNPCTAVGTATGVDIMDGVTFSIVNQYGQTKTYMPSRNGPFQWVSYVLTNSGLALCMEYD